MHIKHKTRNKGDTGEEDGYRNGKLYMSSVGFCLTLQVHEDRNNVGRGKLSTKQADMNREFSNGGECFVGYCVFMKELSTRGRYDEECRRA